MDKMDALVNAVLERILVPLEASGRHVHLTREQAEILFDHGLTPERPLSQPGQYLSKERVTVIGPKGEFRNVAVLGPERRESQVEISLTDGKALGIQPPVRLSGETVGSPGCILVGSQGRVERGGGGSAGEWNMDVAAADEERFGVRDRQVVHLQTFTARPVVFEDTVVRVSGDFAAAVHLDYDEANACGFAKGDWGRILP